MALITLQAAKDHLRVTTDDNNEDIDLKITQAADIVLSYLKGRPIIVSSITSTTGLATVTTPTPHGLTTNDVVITRGALQPEYNGSFAVTVLTTTTFTFVISGTPVSPATGGVAMRTVQTWTNLTIPPRIQAAVLMVLTYLYEHRGDDPQFDQEFWSALERLLVRDRDPAYA
jgi:hypothetical protein